MDADKDKKRKIHDEVKTKIPRDVELKIIKTERLNLALKSALTYDCFEEINREFVEEHFEVEIKKKNNLNKYVM
ncbi:hypothetical protein ATZ36_15060 [Candidatus Endomicrobiellum trichonymphae]|uniref:Uncharacterized protein n=1 Tax=Endomicrobium trichonymphae TaxID=1408204 RepID=A0A1E5ILS1_ENDTX|nr:hypothetical protein ATZ36_15060 [Candidatus Endomicrobium trichonymphae]